MVWDNWVTELGKIVHVHVHVDVDVNEGGDGHENTALPQCWTGHVVVIINSISISLILDTG